MECGARLSVARSNVKSLKRLPCEKQPHGDIESTKKALKHVLKDDSNSECEELMRCPKCTLPIPCSHYATRERYLRMGLEKEQAQMILRRTARE
jgi:hypothetical protein